MHVGASRLDQLAKLELKLGEANAGEAKAGAPGEAEPAQEDEEEALEEQEDEEFDEEDDYLQVSTWTNPLRQLFWPSHPRYHHRDRLTTTMMDTMMAMMMVMGRHISDEYTPRDLLIKGAQGLSNCWVPLIHCRHPRKGSFARHPCDKLRYFPLYGSNCIPALGWHHHHILAHFV